jgi:hypothetical protein
MLKSTSIYCLKLQKKPHVDAKFAKTWGGGLNLIYMQVLFVLVQQEL